MHTYITGEVRIFGPPREEPIDDRPTEEQNKLTLAITLILVRASQCQK